MLAAAVQLNSRADKATNLAAAIAGTEAAAAAGAELIVLPEYTDYLGPAAGAASIAERIPGPTTDVLGALAGRLGVTLVAGSYWERAAPPSTQLYNTVTVFDRSGELRAKYRKVHVFDADLEGLGPASESSMVTPGDHLVNVDVDDLQLGLATCYDLRFPEMFRVQVFAGCRIITVPSAFRTRTGRDHWEVLLRARAIENQCYIVAADQVGEDGRGIGCFGRSMIVDPWGTVLACAPDEPGYITAPIEFDRQDRLRASMPVLRHGRPDVYQLTTSSLQESNR